MWDKADIRIPFNAKHVSRFQYQSADQLAGFVDISKYDFPAHCEIAFVDGEKVYSEPQSKKWGSIASSISSVAVGFQPTGNGFYPWPHVSIKASPSKILQGHNVFGTENIRPGIMQMLSTLKLAFPKIYNHLDIDAAEIRYTDSTYSAFVQSDYQRNQVIKLFESLFPRKNDISRYVGYFQANKTSDYHRQKIYFKHEELLFDLEKAIKSGQQDKAKILGDQRLQDFAIGKLRFEATTGHRAFQNLGIPTRLYEFLKFHDWFEKVHKEPLCRYLWHKTFDKFFNQITGHTMKNVDDESIKLQIDAKFIKIKANGKPCRRKSNAVWRTYRQIKTEGYDQLAKEKNTNFFRNVDCLIKAGISRAFLKSLDPHRPNENVVPIVQLIEIDFSRQRPDWYKEPTAGFSDKRRHLKSVA